MPSLTSMYTHWSQGDNAGMISCFIDLLCKLLRAALVLFVILPFVWIISAPFILIASMFVPGSYRDTVSRAYWLVSKRLLIWGDIRSSR